MAGGRRGDAGGILTLLDTIEEHRGALEYDWRSRFHLPLSCVPDVMGWGEACRLLRLLAADPSSWTAAVVSGWQYPMDRAALALATVAEHTAFALSEKNRRYRYPRPWDEKPKTIGTASMTTTQMRAFLDRFRAQDHVDVEQVVDLTKP